MNLVKVKNAAKNDMFAVCLKSWIQLFAIFFSKCQTVRVVVASDFQE